MAARAPLEKRIERCRRCPRLLAHCQEIARVKRRAYRDEKYWGKPVPSFGVKRPRLLVVGLAPGAHGANRTGRMFTGDSSGAWLYGVLHAHGFASGPESRHRTDPLRLRETVITAAAHCAPPGNKPLRAELEACRPYLVEELRAFRPRLRVVITLGRIGHDAFLKAWREAGAPPYDPKPKFAHGAEAGGDGRPALLASYHPSRQNTQTKRLSWAMFDSVFHRARTILGG